MISRSTKSTIRALIATTQVLLRMRDMSSNKASKEHTSEVRARRRSCAVRGTDGTVDARHTHETSSCQIYTKRDQTSAGSLPSVTAEVAS